MNEAIAEAARKKKAGPNESMRRIDMKLSLVWEFHGILWWFSLVVNGEYMAFSTKKTWEYTAT